MWADMVIADMKCEEKFKSRGDNPISQSFIT